MADTPDTTQRLVVTVERDALRALLDHLRYQEWFQEGNDGEECRQVTAMLDNSPPPVEGGQ